MIADSFLTGCVAAAPDVADLVAGDNPTDDCVRQLSLEAIEAPDAVMQLESGISQCIGNAILGDSGPMARIIILFGSAP